MNAANRTSSALVFRILIATAALMLPGVGGAAYNANMQGKVVTVAFYSDGDYVYFALANQPTAHPSCNPSWFVLDPSVQGIPEARMARLTARLIAAHSSGEVVNVGYDDQGDCLHGFLRVHRVG